MLSVNWKLVIPGCIFASLMVFERLFPLRRRTRDIWGRFFVNIALTATAFAIASVTVKPVAEKIMAWTGGSSFGLSNIIPGTPVVKFVVGFLLMDMTFYWWHRINHRVPFFWRFHNMHHCDPDLDVTTSFRFHACEILFSSGFRALQTGLIAVQPATYAAYELVFTCATMLHHSNLNLPVTIERALNKIIVTPRMHGIHHSIVQNEADSNYSVIFRWWDFIFGSLKLNIHQTQITIGVPGYIKPFDNTIVNLIAIPFGKQRDYWRTSDGTVHVRKEVDPTNTSYLLQ